MNRFTRIVVCVGFLSVAVTPRAAADPIPISSGFLFVSQTSTPSGVTTLVGSRGFSLEARVNRFEGRVDPLDTCTPCAPGSRLSLDSVLGVSAFSGVATLDGRTYPILQDMNAPAFLFLEFFGELILPTIQESPVIVSSPFTMRGTFTVPPPGMTAMLSGSGIASVLLRPYLIAPDEPLLWSASSVHYSFDQQTPVPEPTTLTMLATGLLFAAGARARRLCHRK